MSEAVIERGLTDRTRLAISEALDGRRHGLKAALPLAGPAFVASVAYMDPGNFATNIQAGASFGYSLLWVVLAANLIAILFQAMSAKLGIVTGHTLPELCRDQFAPPVVWTMWIVSEIAAMATDLAEFLGGAIGLSLLLGLPLMVGMVFTAFITYGILVFEKKGFRPLELVITGLVGTIGLCYLVELFIAKPDWGLAAFHLVTPQLPNAAAATLAVGIVGATVMPHAIYLHSGLTRGRAVIRNEAERRTLLRFSNREVFVALSFAGCVNIAMVLMAASAFNAGHSEVAEIQTAYHTLAPLLGAGAASIFLIALMASGISSSAVGTMAGQMIMQGFVKFHIPLWVRRAVTILPSFAVVALGYNATTSLIISQVVLSIVLPVPMIALLLLSRRKSVMGEYRTSNGVFTLAVAATIVVICLNGVLIAQTLGVALPGLA
jgi:manganese transport protein